MSIYADTQTPSHLAWLVNTVAGIAVARVRDVLQLIKNRRDAAVLAGLDDHMLADIGLTRGDLRDAYSEPVWRDPTAVLVSRSHERRINRRRVGIGLAEKTFDAPSIVPTVQTVSNRPRASAAGFRVVPESFPRSWTRRKTTEILGLADLPRRPPSIRTFSSPLRFGPRARRPSRRAFFSGLVGLSYPHARCTGLMRSAARRVALPTRTAC